MDQKKIGSFLKDLRKEKGITQEELAEKMYVSGRTVSRWETGSNMPDLDIMIELADYYDVDLRELLDGERKSETMDKEVKETVMKAADYSNEQKERFVKTMRIMFLFGFLLTTARVVIGFLDLDENPTPLMDFFSGFTLGVSQAMMVLGMLLTTKQVANLQDAKKRMLNAMFRKGN